MSEPNIYTDFCKVWKAGNLPRLSAEREQKGAVQPYSVYDDNGFTRTGRTTDSQLETWSVNVSTFGSSRGDNELLESKIEKAFEDKETLFTAGRHAVLDIRITGHQHFQDDQRVWNMVTNFEFDTVRDRNAA